jgi:hypothetical protein
MDLPILLQSVQESLNAFTLSLICALGAVMVLGLLARVAERWGF